jgi:hypothetical protein
VCSIHLNFLETARLHHESESFLIVPKSDNTQYLVFKLAFHLLFEHSSHPALEIVRFTFTLLFKESQAQRGEVSSDSTRNPRDSLGTCLKKPFISLIGKPDDLFAGSEG